METNKIKAMAWQEGFNDAVNYLSDYDHWVGLCEFLREKTNQPLKPNNPYIKIPINPKDVSEGDFFMIDNRINIAYQVMEVWENVMTVKCKGGCLTLPYDRFTKIDNIERFKEVNRATWFEKRTETSHYIRPI